MKIILPLITVLLLASCTFKHAAKKPIDYNLSAQQWYSLIIKDLIANDRDKADEDYSSMASEHIADPLLKPTLITLAFAHIENEEYIMADFYLEEYIKKFGNMQNIEYIGYLKLKAKFDSFSGANRNEELMHRSVSEIKSYLKAFPNSPFNPLVETMLVKFNLAIYYLDQNIAVLYGKMNRPISQKIYETRLKDSPFYGIKMQDPKPIWYKRIFE